MQAILYDTCGEEVYRTFTTNFYRKTDAVLLMYSVEDTNTFDNLLRWIEDARDGINNDALVWALVGNKSDLPLYVDHKDIDNLSRQLNTPLNFYTSAKTGERVIATFEGVISEVHRRKMEIPSNESPTIPNSRMDGDSFKVHEEPTPKQTPHIEQQPHCC